jgi:hypothetical protein
MQRCGLKFSEIFGHMELEDKTHVHSVKNLRCEFIQSLFKH